MRPHIHVGLHKFRMSTAVIVLFGMPFWLKAPLAVYLLRSAVRWFELVVLGLIAAIPCFWVLTCFVSPTHPPLLVSKRVFCKCIKAGHSVLCECLALVCFAIVQLSVAVTGAEEFVSRGGSTLRGPPSGSPVDSLPLVLH